MATAPIPIPARFSEAQALAWSLAKRGMELLAFAAGALALFVILGRQGVDLGATRVSFGAPGVGLAIMTAFLAWKFVMLAARVLESARDGARMEKEFGSIWVPMKAATEMMYFIPLADGVSPVQWLLLELIDQARWITG